MELGHCEEAHIYRLAHPCSASHNLPMPNVASTLKAEISRVARKEVRGETNALKRAVIAYRHDIAALKRRTEVLERLVRRGSKTSASGSTSSIPEQANQEVRRFSGKGLRSQRKRLGL